MKPTVGRTVLYTNLGDKDGKYPPEQQAAIITKVTIIPEADAPISQRDEENEYTVALHIFYPTGQFDILDVPFSAGYARGHWTWPPRI